MRDSFASGVCSHSPFLALVLDNTCPPRSWLSHRDPHKSGPRIWHLFYPGVLSDLMCAVLPQTRKSVK